MWFDGREISKQVGVQTADRLLAWLVAGANQTKAGSTSAALTAPCILYRGQADADYGLSSGLYRLCAQSMKRGVTEADLVVAETAILGSMRREGLGRGMSDLELLEVLQHHAIPTRLVDVSTTPLEALFFAVDQNDQADGRLFLVRLDKKTAGDALLAKSGVDLPWKGFVRNTRSADRWTQTLGLIDADALDPRMRAQNGKFLVGGLNRRSGGRTMNHIASEDYPTVTTLGINFLGQLRTGSNRSWPATGWTLRIPAMWKRHLRSSLAQRFNITPDTMYPPIGEVRRLALAEARNALSAVGAAP